ncbi:nuclease SbcCD subunit D [Thalassotalea insulae]|uniref:Nuclease SbcCD subunit D n=1 Tax=Thalassotalea insulae TaxID=2056778 RepID=A0ABQ6GZY0_9GAMM|nr:exonuclease subunit SbcD [Thalassotalea insulae]GLX80176.1 nuclease SbcCD subunit D [Thalassotalea insulae]
MTFRILHTSDWHLGQNFYGKSRLKEHQGFINWLLVQVTEQQIDAIVVAGDVFDTGTPPSYARELYFDFIVRLHQLNCQLIVLAGNHDSVAMLGESQSLLAQLGCYVVTQASSVTAQQLLSLTNAKGEQLVVCAIPFIRPRDVVVSSSGQSAKDKQQQLQQAIQAHYQQLVEQAHQQYGEQVAIMATGHLTTVGVSCSESVRDIYIGTLEAFPAQCFPEVDYIALGHIHQAQKVAKSEHIRYCGSPIPLSFDEAAQQKSVNLVDFSQGKLAQVTELAIPCFQPMEMVKTDLDSLKQRLTMLTATDHLAEQQAGESDEQCRIWLDIELSHSDYLNDLTLRVDEIVHDFPVEVILVRRAKKNRALNSVTEENTTLAELRLQDVFDTRLALESWPDPQAEQRKTRLTTLFNEIADQVSHQEAIEEQQPLQEEQQQASK